MGSDLCRWAPQARSPVSADLWSTSEDEHEPLSIRESNRAAWDAIPQKPTTDPFKHVVWEAFTPHGESAKLRGVASPKSGRCVCIFDGAAYARMRSTRMVDLFLGSKGTLREKVSQLLRVEAVPLALLLICP